MLPLTTLESAYGESPVEEARRLVKVVLVSCFLGRLYTTSPDMLEKSRESWAVGKVVWDDCLRRQVV